MEAALITCSRGCGLRANATNMARHVDAGNCRAPVKSLDIRAMLARVPPQRATPERDVRAVADTGAPVGVASPVVYPVA